MKRKKLPLVLFMLLLFTASQFAQMTKSIVEENQVSITPNKEILNIVPNTLEDFESYSDFATSFFPWILNDVDGTVTYGITDVSFPNSGTAMSYIIFNPANTTPSMSGDTELQAHSGNKFAACFASIPSSGPTNNDWLITPTMALGQNSVLTFYGKSYTTDYGAERLKVLVSTTGTNITDFTEISAGTISLPADWTLYTYSLSAYNSQNIHIAFQCVSNDAFIMMLDDILVSTDEVTQGSTLTGKVTNALDGTPVQNALVEIAGLTDYTDAQGNYSIDNVPDGSLTSNFMGSPTQGIGPLSVQFTDLSTSNTQLVTCSASGYTTYNNNQVSIPSGGTFNLDISLSPVISGDGMRFVVNWGADPRDLDSHLRTPEIEGISYHVYYPSGSQGSATSPPYATLDHDVTQGYGPETTTIYQFFTGTYHFYIYKYAGEGEITTSNAVVQIYNESGLIQTLQAPTSGSGDYWYIGTINGSTQTLNIINTIQSTEPGTGKSNVIYPPKPESEKLNPSDITSWNWNFGDGQSSTLKNPTHVYQNGGSYSVTLTVSDGISQHTFTKQNYIIVEGTQGTATISGMVTNALDGVPIEGALVQVAGLSDITDAQGNYLIENVPEGSLTSNFMGTPTQGSSPLNVQFTDLSTGNTQLVTCSATGFSTYNNNQVSIPAGGTVNLNISLSPVISGDEMRFVVNWGADPRDLDSHLRTPEIEGSTYHVYYPSGSQGSATSAPYATLDHDVTQGFGPETTTIYQFFNGTYYYYIYKYAGDGEITTSSAVVQIYNESGLIQTLQAPTSGTGDYWFVGTIDGATKTLNIVNRIQADEPSTGKMNAIYPPKPQEDIQPKSGIISWSWNFGDEQTSNNPNPSHIYQNNGWYTVTLTVGDGTATNTETKGNYIKVGPTAINEVDSEIIEFYPNPANDQLRFMSDFTIKQLNIFDSNGRLVLEQKVNDQSTEVNIEGLQSGIYMIQVHFENQIITRKLMIR